MVRAALEDDRTLLQAWSLRGAPYVFPTRDAAVFTAALLPDDEPALLHLIGGVEPALEQVGMRVGEAVDRTAAALAQVLDGRQVAGKRRLDREVAATVGEGIGGAQLAAWESDSFYAADQRIGEAIVSFALRPCALRGLVCFAGRRGNTPCFVRPDQWLGAPLPADGSPAGLVRRYLHAYGPSTPEHLAAWAGITGTQAARAWADVEVELSAVELDGRTAWILERDLAALDSPPQPSGVRLLPPLDPWVLLRDHATALPDRALHGRVWRGTGWPGTVLVDGDIAGTWRASVRGRTLRLRVEPFARLSAASRAAIETEAHGLAPFRGASTAAVEFAR